MIKQILILLIKSYQYMISGFFLNSCRFTPSCSNYSLVALQKYGVFIGIWLSIKRLSKCHPFCNKEGYDPVQ